MRAKFKLIKKNMFRIRCLKSVKRFYSSVIRFNLERYEHKVNPNQIHYETENQFAYSVISSNPLYKSSIAALRRRTSTDPDFNYSNLMQYLNNEVYKNQNLSEIVTYLANWNRVPVDLSNTIFDKFVDNLMERCPELSDDELLDMISYLFYLTPTNSINYTDIWSCLDDICEWRNNSWSIDRILLTMDYWYQLHLLRLSDFSYTAVRFLSRKPQSLTYTQLIQTLFYMNILRKAYNMIEFEFEIMKHLKEFSVEELGIIAMSFFKTESYIRSPQLLQFMLSQMTESVGNTHEITMASVSKALRFSGNTNLHDELLTFQRSVIGEIDRLAVVALIQIMLAGSHLHVIDEEFAVKTSRKISSHIRDIRLKDLERFLLALSSFYIRFDDCDKILQMIIDELMDESRKKEIETYPRVFFNTVSSLATYGLYPVPLLNMVFDKKLLELAYGRNDYNYGREILVLDASIEIEQPNFHHRRLNDTTRHRLSKVYSEWPPAAGTKNFMQLIILNFQDVLKEVVQGDEYFKQEHVLPQFRHADFIVAFDRLKNQFVPVHSFFKDYYLGHVMRQVSNENVQWYAFVIGGRNYYVNNREDTLIGVAVMKLRQLKAIGYQPVLVHWATWHQFTNEEKVEFIRKRVSS